MGRNWRWFNCISFRKDVDLLDFQMWKKELHLPRKNQRIFASSNGAHSVTSNCETKSTIEFQELVQWHNNKVFVCINKHRVYCIFMTFNLKPIKRCCQIDGTTQNIKNYRIKKIYVLLMQQQGFFFSIYFRICTKQFNEPKISFQSGICIHQLSLQIFESIRLIPTHSLCCLDGMKNKTDMGRAYANISMRSYRWCSMEHCSAYISGYIYCFDVEPRAWAQQKREKNLLYACENDANIFWVEGRHKFIQISKQPIFLCCPLNCENDW